MVQFKRNTNKRDFWLMKYVPKHKTSKLMKLQET